MAKSRTQFICRSCGSAQHRWSGKCPDCGGWSTLEEHRIDTSTSSDPQRGLTHNWQGDEDAADPLAPPVAVPLSRAEGVEAQAPRVTTGVGELDRVLGGGLVAGSAVLIGGDPGIGKSTLLLQAARKLASSGARTLYVTSEESVEQVRLRAQRLGGDAHTKSRKTEDELFVLADTNLARIIEQARQVRPATLIIDSIQMIYKADLDASPGTVTQLRRCCTELVYLAKASGMTVILVGHVTKEGALAGPRLLEHLVDAVLYFEGDRHHAIRILRGVKNRFGATLEIGLFEMTGAGLVETTGVGAIIDAVSAESRPGAAICPVMAGARCVLVEMQALTADGFPGSVKRKASGVDSNRLAMLIAVLEQHGGLRLADRDVFASAVGGMRVVEPGADLALAMAIAGAAMRRSLPQGTAVVGEVGLGGEVRTVAQLEARLRESRRLGCTRALTPAGADLNIEGLDLTPIRTIGEAMDMLAPVVTVKPQQIAVPHKQD
jgi:DNA repair protein RadA/Sms